MNESSDRSRPAESGNTWTATRIAGWVIGLPIALIAGTIMVGIVAGLALSALFGPGAVGLQWAVGFAVTAIYLGWLLARAILRTRRAGDGDVHTL